MGSNLKKWFVISVLLGTMVLSIQLASAVQISDVPPGHWAYEAVRTLVSKGYLPLGSDEPFLGDEPTDRFTLATVVAKIVDEMDSGRVASTPDDVQVLLQVIEDLRTDMVGYHSEVQRVARDVNKKDATIDALDERLVDTIDMLGILYEDLVQLGARLDETNVALSDIDRRVSATETDLDLHRDETRDGFIAGQLAREQMEARLQEAMTSRVHKLSLDFQRAQDDNEVQFTNIGEAIAQVRKHLNEHTEALFAQDIGLSQVVQQLDARTLALDDLLQTQGAELAAESAKLSGQLQTLDRKLQSLERDLVGSGDATSAQLGGVDLAIGDMRRQLNAHAEDIAVHQMTLDDLVLSLQDHAAEQQIQEAEFGKILQNVDDHGSRLAENLAALEQQLATLSNNVLSLENETAESDSLTAARLGRVDEAIGEIRSELNAHAEGLAVQQVAIDDLLQTVGTRLQQLETELAGKGDATTTQLGRIDEAIGEIRGELNAHAEELAMQQLALDSLLDSLNRQTEALARTDGQLLETIEEMRRTMEDTLRGQTRLEDTVKKLEASLETEVAAWKQEHYRLSERLDEVHGDLLITQSHIGLSEEQVSALTRRVREDLAEQLTLSLVREGELDRELKDLRREFDGYRTKTEDEIKGLKGGSVVGYLALGAGIIALFAK